MANINDFKLLNSKCKYYFQILQSELRGNYEILNEKQKERFGFYLFMLESICNIKDTYDLIELITDQDFNSTFFNDKNEDFGIDAIFIDSETNTINLFNFKFREKFNANNQQGVNDTFTSSKFLNIIQSQNVTGLNGKIKSKADEIINRLFVGNDIWKLVLYIISNESKELDISSNEIANLRKLYDLEVKPYNLDSISKIMSIRPKPINAVLHINNDFIIPFDENNFSSSKSYIIKIQATELLRITCDNETFRGNYNMEDYKQISFTDMEYNLIFENVRGLILRSKFNENIYQTLREEPSKFFMYNNGLTITANDIESESTSANKKIKIVISDFQVVNGGQTLRTLHKFNQESSENIGTYLSNCELLIRVFKTSPTSGIRNKIAEFTNSQNAISNIDLKSLRAEQIQIEQFLDENNIIYVRKTGDTGLKVLKEYEHRISMEKFGQILFSIQGFPHKASNQKKQIFDKYYSNIFSVDQFDLTTSATMVRRYFAIKNAYDNSGFISSDQKIFYILYIDQYIHNEINEKISILESHIKNYSTNEQISDARKLIQSKFKETLDEIIYKPNEQL